jgi:O-antigen ligase
MGAVAATFGGAVVVAVTTLKSRASLLSWIVRLVVLLALAGLLYSAFGTQVFERLDSLGTDANTRTTLYQQVIAMITARPWLGYGGGSFEFAFPLFQHPPLTADTVWDKAHSSYLELWAETGIVAGSLPMLAILGALLMAIANLIRSAGRLDINAAAVGAVAAVAVHSLVDFSLEVQAVAYIFVAILALAVAHRPPASPASRERR